MKLIPIVTLVGLLLDQLSKYIISNNLMLYSKNKIMSNFFYVTYVRNEGAAWSILDGNRIFLIIITIIGLIAIVGFIKKEGDRSKLQSICYGMLLGGILGNFIDRVFRGYVIDFLDFKVLGYNFPIFNVADILIVLGIFIMIVSELGGIKNANRGFRK